MTKPLAALALAAAFLAAAPPARAANPHPDKRCIAVVVGTPQPPGVRNGQNDDDREFGSGTTTFSATSVTDIEFAIVFAPQIAAQFTNVHVVEFRVFTPAGNLYESMSIPITTDARRAGERHRVPGYPDLVPVQVLKGINAGNGNGRNLFAKVTLPVAGTPILSNSLYGIWKADALVEEQTTSCGTPAVFTITR